MGQQCAAPCFLTLAHDPSCQQPSECGSGTQYLPTHLWPVPFGTQGVRRGCLRTVLPPVPSSPTPLRCTTTGTSIAPLESLARRLEAWLTPHKPSRWLTRTIRLGYAIQFARRPPKFNDVLETSVAVRNTPVLREKIAVLLAKDAIEPVPPAEMRQGFHSPYLIVPKEGGHRPILDRRVFNRSLHKPPFKMLTSRRVIKCIQLQDWFSVIDLKDAYFHVSILLRHRRSYDLRLRGPLEQVYRHTVVTTGALHATGRQPRALDGAPTALAYQLPTAVDSASSLTAVPATAVGQARASPHGQHCGCLMHQPVGRYTITPHVTARPPSPPLESHAVQVTARCPHPGEAQSCGRRALTTAQVPWRMMTPFRDDPADLESIWGSSDRPVCCL